MWYPTAVGSCVLKLMLRFEFLYTLPQEVRTTKQSLCPQLSACASLLIGIPFGREYALQHAVILNFLIFFFTKLHFGMQSLPPSAYYTCMCFQLQSTLIYILCKNAKLWEHISGGLQLSQDRQHLYSSASAKHHTEGSVPTPLVLLKLISGYCYVFQGLLWAVSPAGELRTQRQGAERSKQGSCR